MLYGGGCSRRGQWRGASTVISKPRGSSGAGDCVNLCLQRSRWGHDARMLAGKALGRPDLRRLGPPAANDTLVPTSKLPLRATVCHGEFDGSYTAIVLPRFPLRPNTAAAPARHQLSSLSSDTPVSIGLLRNPASSTSAMASSQTAANLAAPFSLGWMLSA